MTLDFHRVAALLQELGQRLAQESRQQEGRLARAQALLHAQEAEALARRVEEARTSWLLALPLHEPPDARIPPPPAPQDYAAIAADGSHIDADRHMPARCYLLNVGWAQLTYGQEPAAELGQEPRLGSREEELALLDAQDPSRQEAISGHLLAARRSLEEMAALARLAEGSPPHLPTLALLDGALVLWGLGQGAYPPLVQKRLFSHFLDEGVLAHLDRLRRLAEERPLVVAAYISHPGGTEVANGLRVAACPMARVACEDCPGPGRRDGDALGVGPGAYPFRRPCDEVAVAADRELFRHLLKPGERSAVFRRRSAKADSALARYERRGHPLAFFYLRLPQEVAGEVARVELPLWLAQEPQRLALLHALLLDQCQRGLGYPVAIAEAHERAVITGADRELFSRLLEEALVAQGLPAVTSAKSLSKRLRWL